MSKRRLLIAVLLLATGASVNASDSELTIDDKDRENAVKFYGGDPDLKLTNHESRLPDGARGFTFFGHPEPMMYHGQETLRHYACSYAIFGVADLQDAKSFVGKNEIGILTKLRFKIVDNWKAGSIPKDQFFDLIIPGGEVMHKGEMFRLGDPLTSYIKGRRYLMIIQGDTKSAEKNYFVELPRLLEVSNGIIRAPYSATPFDGMSLSGVKASAQEALEQKGCE